MKNDIERILYSEEDLAQCVQRLGAEISKDYEGKEIFAVAILKGAVVFFTDLIRAINVPVQLDFMAASSYGASTKSSGTVKILKDLDFSVEGKHVLIIEDIIDSGLTLHYLLRIFKERGPASVKLCALLDKPERRKAPVKIDYSGFTVPDEFLVGYGLDYAEKYRNLPCIGILKKEIYTE